MRDQLPGASTSQFRALLLRALKNQFPGLEPTIGPAERGITFQLYASDGRARTNVVSIYRQSAQVLSRSGLRRRILNAGRPPGGFPAGLEFTG